MQPFSPKLVAMTTCLVTMTFARGLYLTRCQLYRADPGTDPVSAAVPVQERKAIPDQKAVFMRGWEDEP